MPTYTYRCGNCGHHFDLYQLFDEADPNVCPSCGMEHRLQRVYKPVGVVFKGSGFYATDNKTRSGAALNGKPAANGTGSGEEKSGKSEPSKDSGSSTDNSPPSSPTGSQPAD